MKVVNVDNITREDGTEYSKFEFDTKHFAVLNKGEFAFQWFTPTGRKASDEIAERAIKAINIHYDQL